MMTQYVPGALCMGLEWLLDGKINIQPIGAYYDVQYGKNNAGLIINQDRICLLHLVLYPLLNFNAGWYSPLE